MKPMEEIPVSVAAHIVQRMGESGQPPERRALAVNVGTEDILRVLRDEYLVPIREHGRNSSFKLVQAPYGGGKTQFLHCLRELAEGEGFASALVGLSPKDCPFDDAAKIFRAVAREIELPLHDPEEKPRRGFAQVIRHLVDERVAQAGKAAFSSWLREELAMADVESPALLRATVAFAEAVIERSPDRMELLGDYLRGETMTLAELAPFRIRELPDGEAGFRFLRSIAQILRAMQVPGLLLLFDEMDRTMSLPKKKKRSIGDNLRQMIDHTGQSVLPGVLMAYAVPPEFIGHVAAEYPALTQRLNSTVSFSKVSPLSPVIDLDRLPIPQRELFEQIGLKLLDLYGRAYSVDLDRPMQEANIRALAREMSANAFEAGSRRSFVKAAVTMLGAQHRDVRQKLSEADLRKLSRRAMAEEAPGLEGERLV